jgi:hypothetical protein
MRPIIVILVFLVTGGLLVARASSSDEPTTAVVRAAVMTSASGATATESSTAAGRLTTKAQAVAFAHAVNLTAADVPGFKISLSHAHETAAEKRLEHEMLRCVGALGSNHGIVEMSSGEYERETSAVDESVQSEVSVARTPALAARELAAIRGAASHVRACLSHYLNLLFKSRRYDGATVSPVSITQGTPPAPGATGSFAWRIATTITLRRVAVPVHINILGFVDGPAEVSLFTAGVPQPFPPATEERLFSLLLARAKLHGA